jgi:hypothetical protein
MLSAASQHSSPMAQQPTFPEAVDAFMASAKTIVGATDMVWQPGIVDGEQCVKLPLEVNGELHGQKLVITAYPRADELKFSIGIVFPPAICRLDYDQHAYHVNSMDCLHKHNISVIVEGPHFHSWPINKQFITSSASLQRLLNAEPVRQRWMFDAAFRWFCSQCNIMIPWDGNFELPARDTLL